MNTGEASATVDWLVLATAVFLASAAGRLRAGRRTVSAGCGLPNGSRRPLAESADGVAARRLAVAACSERKTLCVVFGLCNSVRIV
jgi:hypothetical protein